MSDIEILKHQKMSKMLTKYNCTWYIYGVGQVINELFKDIFDIKELSDYKKNKHYIESKIKSFLPFE